MNLKARRRAPLIICAGVIAVVGLLQALPDWWAGFDIFERLEWMTYDWRVRQAFHRPAPHATNLAAVFIDDDSLKLINDRFGFQYPWPRQLHGRTLRNLRTLETKAVGFDILFRELEPPNPRSEVKLPDGQTVSSDEFFARQLAASSNAVLAVFSETAVGKWEALPPADLFRTNAWALGHTTSDTDSDGVLRRARAFRVDARLGRIWHMGIVLAARELELDLDHPILEPGRILLRGRNGLERAIPVDEEGFFYIDWSMAWNDPRLKTARVESVLGYRALDGTPSEWKDKLVFIGSIGSGNNISDLGATPISKHTYLLSKHWNVANSMIVNRFVRTMTYPAQLFMITLLGIVSGWCTWNLRAPFPSLIVVALAAALVGIALWLYVASRFWLPLVLPVGGSLVMTHVAVTTYQIFFEQKERQRVRNMFAKLVSPNVVTELLQTEKLDLAGTRREITVLFTDVRGFTEMTESIQEAAEIYARQHNLAGAAAEEFFSQQAKMTLDTVNEYLSVVADQVKKHEGTLDKYIGDCVMAFWGAPTANPRHAAACVRAAIDAQQAIEVLNQQRGQLNRQRETENKVRATRGQLPLPMLPQLALGTGINSGLAIVGLMGSDAHVFNYTVFGREVNLASRLEGASGSNRILISLATYKQLLEFDKDLAEVCIKLDPITVKGIRTPVFIYEVPWKQVAKAVPQARVGFGSSSQPDS